MYIKVAQICSMKRIMHKYAVRIEICTNMQPGWKFAQICSKNGNLHKYAVRIEICTNMQPEWKFLFFLIFQNVMLWPLTMCVIPKFPFHSISNCFWDKSKFMFLELSNFWNLNFKMFEKIQKFQNVMMWWLTIHVMPKFCLFRPISHGFWVLMFFF